MNTLPDTSFLDRCGIALSSLCLVHCLAVPVALAMLPVMAVAGWGDVLRAEWLHAALLVPVALVSGTVIGRRARDAAWPVPLLIAAFGMMAGALLAGTQWLEQALTVGGASLLILAHGLNLYRRAGR